MKKMKRRFLALLLCVAMILNISPTIPAHASSSELLTVMYDGDPVDSVVLPVNERIKLKADRALLGSGTYQWQILAYDTIWVDIAGAEGKTVEISYAMIASLLENDEAVIRCKVTKGENVTYSSEVVIEVDYDVATDSNAIEIEEESPSNARVASGSNADEDDEEVTTEPVKVSRVFSLLRRAVEGSTYVATPLNDDSTAPATYNVVINYVFENNEIVADPYTANLAAGSNFTTTITFPTVQGYLPHVDDVQKDSIELSYTAIDKDYTINVVYKPTNVNYTVIHYQQNLYDDNYTEDEDARETKQGLTNSTVPEVAKNYDGFYALLYEKPAIAADGSTVVEIYYDRYYYLMNFNLDGGYGTEPIYARYGAPIGDVGTPTKAGYTFSGWSLDGSTIVSLPDTMPAKNNTYKAVWKANDTAKVTVVFWGENADDEEYSYLPSDSFTTQQVPGTQYTYSPGTLICTKTVHEHDSDCYNLICNIPEHTHNGDCQINCTHTHALGCYSCNNNDYELIETSKPVQITNVNGDGIYIYQTQSYGWTRTHYYLLVDGKWYCAGYNGRWGSYTDDSIVISEVCTHVHNENCYSCGMKEHAHSDYLGSCYSLSCIKEEHVHTANCYENYTGLDSNLWTFVMSDTVTVAADGSSVVNVYYDRTKKTMTFHYDYSNKQYSTTATITDKWGADIGDRFLQMNTNAKGNLWSSNSSGKSPWTSYLQIMPEDDRDYYYNQSGTKEQTAKYYTETLTEDQYEVAYAVTAYYNNNLTISAEDFYPMEGFTYSYGIDGNGNQMNQPGPYGNFDGAEFYYTRNSYSLTFNDGYANVKTKSVKYEMPLDSYMDYKPDVPSAYQSGSVFFDGWYQNPECTGEEYKLDKHIMPAKDVLLYAKWTPVTHTVRFYLDKDAYEAETKLDSHPDIRVPHGSKADPTPDNPTNGSYNFIGWFYMEDGVEKAFDFANMPVNKNLEVYGKWSSNVLKTYTIYYKIQDTDTEIAAATTGSGLAGITKTFDAKGGTELYADYQEGYFPLVKSHSMTLDINATEENDTNVFTFWYVQKEAVPYTVKYLNKETREPVVAEKTVSDNRKAVVTETFVPVSGMMPDAYQKRLIVSAKDGAVNEIIFYYEEDTTHAFYKITHYTENLAQDAQGNPTWTEYASSQAVGDIGTIYTADPMTIPGFTYNSEVTGTVASGELTANGLELKLYYTRNSYPYIVRYLEKGTNKVLADPKTDEGKYGQVVSESAIAITDYVAVAPTSQTLNIRIEEDKNNPVLNIITFYYEEAEVVINYKVVDPDGKVVDPDEIVGSDSCGSVSPTSETLKVFTGTASGSTPTANPGFRFVGWYTDANCTIPVDASAVGSNNTFVPAKYEPTEPEDAKGYYVADTYYAKFDYDNADLIISKVVDTNDNQTYIFKVECADTGFSTTVAVNGNESVTLKDLKAGKEYTVTEILDWAWRYDLADVSAKHAEVEKDVASGKASFTLYKYSDSDIETITFTNTKNDEKKKWIDDSARIQNVFIATEIKDEQSE